MMLTALPAAVSAKSISDLTGTAGVATVEKETLSDTASSHKKTAEAEKNESKKVVREEKSHNNEFLLAENATTVTEETEKPEETSASTDRETSNVHNPALMTVGVETVTDVDYDEEEEEAGETELEIFDIQDDIQDGDDAAQDEEPAAEESGDESVDLKPGKRNTEEEDFSNLVIARVNDYVNVRAEASEESDIVGKLYNKSVGDLIETEGDWYKIRSGNCTGYVKGEYVVTGDEAVELAAQVGTRMAVVTTTTLYVRKEATTDSEVIGMVPIEDELLVLEELEGWAKVSVEEGDGYVSTEFVRLYTEFVRAESKEEEEARLAKEEAERKAAEEAARKAREKQQKSKSTGKSGGGKSSGGSAGSTGATYAVSGSGTGSSVASYALQFVGNPYVYGGSSLTNGTDCSGFVMSVYRNFGVSLPHSSGGDRSVGRDVGGIGNAQAGDIVCYSGHVGIYIGGGQIVHASTPSSGIKVSNANYRQILAVRRVF